MSTTFVEFAQTGALVATIKVEIETACAALVGAAASAAVKCAWRERIAKGVQSPQVQRSNQEFLLILRCYDKLSTNIFVTK